MKPFYASDKGAIYCGKAETLLSAVELPAIATVITDPPWYGFAYASAVAVGHEPYSETEDARWLAHLNAFYAGWLPRLRQIVDYQSGRAWVFLGPDYLGPFTRMAKLSGWPMRSCWFETEQEALVQFGRPTSQWMAEYVKQQFQQSIHPNIKEPSLLGAIMQASGPGVVLDPFCGRGSTLVAAIEHGCYAVGIEANPALCSIAADALASR